MLGWKNGNDTSLVNFGILDSFDTGNTETHLFKNKSLALGKAVTPPFLCYRRKHRGGKDILS